MDKVVGAVVVLLIVVAIVLIFGSLSGGDDTSTKSKSGSGSGSGSGKGTDGKDKKDKAPDPVDPTVIPVTPGDPGTSTRYYMLQNHGMCLMPLGDKMAMVKCDASQKAQLFRDDAHPKGGHKLTNFLNDRCLAAGDDATLRDACGDDATRWDYDQGLIKQASSGKCLDVRFRDDKNTYEPPYVEQCYTPRSGNQLWNMNPTAYAPRSTNTFQLQSGGKCLVADGSDKMRLSDCNRSDAAQKYTLIENSKGGYNFKSASGKCLDALNVNDHNAYLNERCDTDGQRWAYDGRVMRQPVTGMCLDGGISSDGHPRAPYTSDCGDALTNANKDWKLVPSS